MRAGLVQQIRNYLADHRRRKRFAMVASVLSACTVLIVCAALLRPAISMQSGTSTADETMSENLQVSTTDTVSETATSTEGTTDASAISDGSTDGTATTGTADAADTAAESVSSTDASDSATGTSESTTDTTATTSAVTATSSSDALLTAQSDITVGSETYRTILGSGVYYGITARTWNQKEAETNAAVEVLNGSQQTGNDRTNKANQPWVIGRVNDSFIIKGNNADVWCRAEDASKIIASGNTINYNYCDEATLDSYVEDIITNATAYSEEMADKSSFSSTDTHVTNNGKVTVDITGLGSGTYYVNLDSAYAKQQADGLIIKKDSGQTLVLNYTGTSVTLQKYTCVIDNTSYSSETDVNADGDKIARTIIWNMPNATTVDVAGATTGVLLAPKATLTINGTSRGWIVANTVNSAGGEWHNTWQEMDQNYDKPGSSGFVAYKTVDGATPTADQVFTFCLAERDSDGGWNVIQEKKNVGGKVTFDDISYTTTGTHYYRITEKGDNAGYADNTTAYYVKTVVTATKVSDTTYYHASSTYYSDDGFSNAISAAVTFDNTTSTSVPVTKVWDDSNDASGIRPTSVTVHLLADGIDTGKTVTLSSDNNWSATFSNLAANSGGKEIAYTVSEDAVTGYSTSITGKASSGYTITNTHDVHTTAVTVNKIWKNTTTKFPITVKLYKSATNNYPAPKTSTTHTVSFSNDGGPTYSVADGSSIIVTVSSAGWPNDPELPSSATYTMGTKSGPVTVKGPTYGWSGYRGFWTASYEVDDITDDVSIALDDSDLYFGFTFNYKNVSSQVIAGSGSSAGSSTTASAVNLPSDATLVDKKTLSADNAWAYSWAGLNADYTYYVVEEAPDGYLATYSYVVDASTGKMTATTITNTADYILPHTGGRGTICLYLFGASLVIAAAGGLYLLRKRESGAGGGGR